jgi:hypothetical protein
MNNEELQQQLKVVISCLKGNKGKSRGIFAIQFVAPYEGYNDSVGDGMFPFFENPLTRQKSGTFMRNREQFANMVKNANGTILKMWDGSVYKEWNFRWIFAHIEPNNPIDNTLKNDL